MAGEDRKGFGFGSKEASKRDEFSNTIRTEQYRTTMKKEMSISMRAQQANMQTLTDNLSDKLAILNNTLATTSHSNSITQNNANTNNQTGFSYSDQVPR